MMNSKISLINWAFLVLFIMIPSVFAYSRMLSICEITEARMLSGMGGANNPNLQMSIVLNSIDTTNSKAVISLSSTNEDVLRNGIRGLLMWAIDGNGTRIGSWTLRENQQLITPICSGGAVSHSGPGQKLINNNDNSLASVNSITFSVPKTALNPISIRSMVVYTRRDWQLLEPVVAQGLGTNNTGLGPTNRAFANVGGNFEHLYTILVCFIVSAMVTLG